MIPGQFPRRNCPAARLLMLLVFVQAECLSILPADAQFISGTVERPTDKKPSQCFAIATAASSHPISCGMATSRNWPQRIWHIPSRRWGQRLFGRLRRSSIPNLAPLSLYGDTGGILELYPYRAQTGSIGPSPLLETVPSAPSRQARAKTPQPRVC